MLIGWKYIYKRRGWTSSLIFNSLQEKTWQCFQDYFKERNIECPPKSEFDNVYSQFLKSQNLEKETPKVKELPKNLPTSSSRKKTRRNTRKKVVKDEPST